MFLLQVTDGGLLVATLDELHQLSYKMFISALQSQVRGNIIDTRGFKCLDGANNISGYSIPYFVLRKALLVLVLTEFLGD